MRNLDVLVLFGLLIGAVACSTSATSPSAPTTQSTASKSNTKRQLDKVSTEVRPNDGKERPNDGGTKRQPDEALAELRASDDEWRQSDAKFRKLRRDKTLAENEVDFV